MAILYVVFAKDIYSKEANLKIMYKKQISIVLYVI